jgi:hypothetical protein
MGISRKLERKENSDWQAELPDPEPEQNLEKLAVRELSLLLPG